MNILVFSEDDGEFEVLGTLKKIPESKEEFLKIINKYGDYGKYYLFHKSEGCRVFETLYKGSIDEYSMSVEETW